MNIQLTPEQERVVREELQSGRSRSAEEVIGKALHALREQEEGSLARASGSAQQEAVREMLVFSAKNRVRLQDISVKELIHQGHRL